eukprot:3854953-Pyramimonas_sp.AAC.1
MAVRNSGLHVKEICGREFLTRRASLAYQRFSTVGGHSCRSLTLRILKSTCASSLGSSGTTSECCAA